MSIIGAKFWSDRETAYFIQTNNPTEHLLRCLLPQGKSTLETCGPTASVNCQTSMGRNVVIKTPGGDLPQPEEVLSDWFNDSRNFEKMRREWSGLDPEKIPGNEVSAWYPLAVREVFGNKCVFVGQFNTEQAIAELRLGRALQVCLIKPGHYISIVAFDEDQKYFIIKDSWGGRWSDGNGFCKTMSLREYETNLKPMTLVYY